MKKMKRTAACALTAVLAVSAVLTGCGGSKKLTAEEIIAQMNENMAKLKSYEASMDMDVVVNVNQNGYSMDLDVKSAFDFAFITETKAIKAEGSVSVLGQNLDIAMYGEQDGDSYTMYLNNSGEWQAQAVELAQMDQFSTTSFDLGNTYTLAEKTEKIDDVECYVLTTSITFDDFMNKVKEELTEEQVKELDEALKEYPDVKGLEFSYTMYVNKDTMIVKEVTMDLADLINKIVAMVESSYTDMVKVSSCSLVVTIDSVDSIDKIEIPAEAKKVTVEDAGSLTDINGILDDDVVIVEEESEDEILDETEEETEEPETEEESLTANADGTYTLTTYDGSFGIDVGIPEGYELSSYSSQNYLIMEYATDDYAVYANMMYNINKGWSETSGPEAVLWFVDYYNDTDGYNDVEVSDVLTCATAAGTVEYMKIAYTYEEDMTYVEYYTWMPLEQDIYLYVTATEYGYQKDCTVLDDSCVSAMYAVINR